MTRTIKTALVALSVLAGASIGYAADNNGNGRGNMPGAVNQDHGGPSLEERRQMTDPNATGSIQPCDSRAYDEFGNCVANPDMQ